ncbi:MAG: hypothetical protein ACRC2H_01365 [Silanimonas sp.]
MAHKFEHACLGSSATTGTGPVTEAAAVAGFRSCASAMAVGDTALMHMWEVDAGGNRTGVWEFGLYTQTSAGVFARTEVSRSSSGGAAVSWVNAVNLAISAHVPQSIAPAALSADVNDWNPVDLLLADDIEVTLSATVKLTGIAAKWQGQTVTLRVREDQAQCLWLQHERAGSAANNRLDLPSGRSILLTPGDSIKLRQLRIGATETRWQVVSRSDYLSRVAAGTSGLKVATVVTSSGATTASASGIAVTNTGTATAASVAATNSHTRAGRLDLLVTTAAATAVAGARTTARFLRGASAGVGGFWARWAFGPATGVSLASRRAFWGIRALTGAPTDVDPNTLVDCVGIGYSSAETDNVHLFHNDATGAPTKINLGANFPKPAADRVNWYDFWVFSLPNGGGLIWEAYNYTNNAVAGGVLTADIPAQATLLCWNGYVSVGGTSSVIGLALGDATVSTPI